MAVLPGHHFVARSKCARFLARVAIIEYAHAFYRSPVGLVVEAVIRYFFALTQMRVEYRAARPVAFRRRGSRRGFMTVLPDHHFVACRQPTRLQAGVAVVEDTHALYIRSVLSVVKAVIRYLVALTELRREHCPRCPVRDLAPQVGRVDLPFVAVVKRHRRRDRFFAREVLSPLVVVVHDACRFHRLARAVAGAFITMAVIRDLVALIPYKVRRAYPVGYLAGQAIHVRFPAIRVRLLHGVGSRVRQLRSYAGTVIHDGGRFNVITFAGLVVVRVIRHFVALSAVIERRRGKVLIRQGLSRGSVLLALERVAVVHGIGHVVRVLGPRTGAIVENGGGFRRIRVTQLITVGIVRQLFAFIPHKEGLAHEIIVHRVRCVPVYIQDPARPVRIGAFHGVRRVGIGGPFGPVAVEHDRYALDLLRALVIIVRVVRYLFALEAGIVIEERHAGRLILVFVKFAVAVQVRRFHVHLPGVGDAPRHAVVRIGVHGPLEAAFVEVNGGREHLLAGAVFQAVVGHFLAFYPAEVIEEHLTRQLIFVIVDETVRVAVRGRRIGQASLVSHVPARPVGVIRFGGPLPVLVILHGGLDDLLLRVVFFGVIAYFLALHARREIEVIDAAELVGVVVKYAVRRQLVGIKGVYRPVIRRGPAHAVGCRRVGSSLEPVLIQVYAGGRHVLGGIEPFSVIRDFLALDSRQVVVIGYAFQFSGIGHVDRPVIVEVKAVYYPVAGLVCVEGDVSQRSGIVDIYHPVAIQVISVHIPVGVLIDGLGRLLQLAAVGHVPAHAVVGTGFGGPFKVRFIKVKRGGHDFLVGIVLFGIVADLFAFFTVFVIKICYARELVLVPVEYAVPVRIDGVLVHFAAVCHVLCHPVGRFRFGSPDVALIVVNERADDIPGIVPSYRVISRLLALQPFYDVIVGDRFFPGADQYVTVGIDGIAPVDHRL